MGKISLPYSRRKKNSFVTFAESLVTLPRNVGIKATQVRGCYNCGELTDMRKKCQKLKQNSSKTTSCKKAGLEAKRVMETQRSASGGNAGKADTRYDVRTEVQDGLLQLASGKRVPAMIDCGALGGKRSARELNLRSSKLLETRQPTC